MNLPGSAAESSRLAIWQRRFGKTRVQGAYLLVTSIISFGTLALIAVLLQQPFVFPSLGASVFVFYFSAQSVQAAPRNVFFGQLIGLLAGVFALAIFGLLDVGPDLTGVSWARAGALTLALCLTLSVMVWLRVPHAPAGATTLIVEAGLMTSPQQLVVLLLAVLVIIGQAIVISRVVGVPIPLWAPAATSRASR